MGITTHTVVRYWWLLVLAVLSSDLNAQVDPELVRSQSNALFSQNENYAVIVGVDKYDLATPLNYAVADARRLAEFFRGQGYEVDLLIDSDATPTRILRTLETAARAATNDNTVEQGNLVFAFSGHGFRQEGENYLATPETNPIAIRETSLALSAVQKVLSESRVRQRVLFIDACRNDPSKGSGYDNGTFVDDSDAQGEAILYSTRSGTLSWEDNKLGHGVFTHYLVEGLEGAAAGSDGLVSFRDLEGYVIDRVKKHVKRRFRKLQIPYIGGERTGEFVVATYTPELPQAPEIRVPAVRPVAGEPGSAADRVSDRTVELALWQAARDLDALDGYLGYLQRFPAGIFSDSARDRVQGLESKFGQGGGGTAPPSPGMGRLLLRLVPADARAYIGGSDTPVVSGGIELPAGKNYELVVRRRDYRVHRENLYLDPGVVQKTIELEPLKRSTPVGVSDHARVKRAIETLVQTGVVDRTAGKVVTRGEWKTLALAEAARAVVARAAAQVVQQHDTGTDSGNLQTLTERLTEDPLFRTSVLDRATDLARPIRALREWDGDQYYFVEAEWQVATAPLLQALRASGVLFEHNNASKVEVSVQRESGSGTLPDRESERRVQEILRKSGFTTDGSVDNRNALKLVINLRHGVTHSRQYDTYSADCVGSFELTQGKGETLIGSGNRSTQPEGGFSGREVLAKCDQRVLEPLTNDAVDSLRVAASRNRIVRNSLRLSIGNVSAARLAETTRGIAGIFRVEEISRQAYTADHLEMQVVFLGETTELYELLTRLFTQPSQTVELVELSDENLHIAFR